MKFGTHPIPNWLFIALMLFPAVAFMQWLATQPSGLQQVLITGGVALYYGLLYATIIRPWMQAKRYGVRLSRLRGSGHPAIIGLPGVSGQSPARAYAIHPNAVSPNWRRRYFGGLAVV